MCYDLMEHTTHEEDIIFVTKPKEPSWIPQIVPKIEKIIPNFNSRNKEEFNNIVARDDNISQELNELLNVQYLDNFHTHTKITIDMVIMDTFLPQNIIQKVCLDAFVNEYENLKKIKKFLNLGSLGSKLSKGKMVKLAQKLVELL